MYADIVTKKNITSLLAMFKNPLEIRFVWVDASNITYAGIGISQTCINIISQTISKAINLLLELSIKFPIHKFMASKENISSNAKINKIQTSATFKILYNWFVFILFNSNHLVFNYAINIRIF